MVDLSESKMAEREFRTWYVREKVYIAPKRVFYC